MKNLEMKDSDYHLIEEALTLLLIQEEEQRNVGDSLSILLNDAKRSDIKDLMISINKQSMNQTVESAMDNVARILKERADKQ